jgi:hypothetical protein
MYVLHLHDDIAMTEIQHYDMYYFLPLRHGLVLEPLGEHGQCSNGVIVGNHMSSVMERDKRDSTLVVQSLFEPSDMSTFRIGKVVNLGGTVCGTVGSGQVGHDGFYTDRIDHYESATIGKEGLTHVGFTSVKE